MDHDVEVDDDDDDDDLGVRSTCGQPITDVECGHDCCCFQFEVGIRDTNAWLLLRNAKRLKDSKRNDGATKVLLMMLLKWWMEGAEEGRTDDEKRTRVNCEKR